MSTYIKALLVSGGMAVLVAVAYAQTAPANPEIPAVESSPRQGEANAGALARAASTEEVVASPHQQATAGQRCEERLEAFDDPI